MADMHKALLFVTKTAVETDADSSRFPKDWLMLHRWGKGKKGGDVNKLPSGEQVEFLKVGGRTSAYVRKLQRKVGPVAGEEGAPKRKAKRQRVKEDEESEEQAAKEEKGEGSGVKGKPKKRHGRKLVEVRPDPGQAKIEVTEKPLGEHEPIGIKLEVKGLRRSSRRKVASQ